MKHWFYSEGNILGPYEPAELLAMPAFAEESLVCPETSTGDNPGDWRPAMQVADIAAALTVGAGRAINSGSAYGSYEYETGYNPSINYFENKESGPMSSYGELLDAIDGVLGANKEGAASSNRPAETDYDLADKLDIRLSRIQEELEAARWEKNLLLEKIRMKEMEEKKNLARIHELEARVKGELEKTGETVRELEQVRHLSDLKENAETLRQIEEIKKEELSLKEDAELKAPPPPVNIGSPAAAPKEPQKLVKAETIKPELIFKDQEQATDAESAPEIAVKSFKSMKPGSQVKLESSLGREMKEEIAEAGVTSRQLKSLGQTQEPAYVYGSHYDKPLPGPEPAPAGAFNPEPSEPLPQQAGGVMYDFTVVTSKPDVQRFQIEPRQEAVPAPTEPLPVKPPTYDMGIPQQAQAPVQRQPSPAPAPQPAFQFQPVQPVMGQPPVQQPMPQHIPQPVPAMAPAAESQPQTFSPSVHLEPAPIASPQGKPPAEPADSPDKTQRIPVPEVKGKAAAAPNTSSGKPKRGGRTAFLVILVIFGSIAAGGLGYFFLGEGVSLSEVLMLSSGHKKTAALPSQIEPKAEEAAPENTEPAAELAPEPQPEPAAQPEPAPLPANANIKKALDIVKNYKLSGGRGNISTWFANSFLSNSGGANEEWTATPLHGDILVVQYRLLRPRQEPLIYQFEVDAAKNDIVRGINNNAIDLLDLDSKEKSASAARVKRAARKPKVSKTSGSREIPILPLPEAPSAGPGDQDPTGFENPPLEPEQVKYLKAQESDEELF